MSMNFNLRGIASEVMSLLKSKADAEVISINTLILKLIEEGIGYSFALRRPLYHELDSLAGTWSSKDAAEFNADTSHFEQIDKEIW